MARSRKGAQLSLELDPALLERLRAHAAAQERPVATILRRWIEAGLDGALGTPEAPAAPALSDLSERVGRLEAEVARLRSPASPEQAIPAPPTGAPLPLPERRLTPAEAEGLLTTPEVGAALGLASDSALTNWIAREASKRGGSAVGGIYRGHRLRGKALLPGGQKPGWLWEPA